VNDGSSPAVLERGTLMGMGMVRDVKVRVQNYDGDFIRQAI
jgi:hypothetical protein